MQWIQKPEDIEEDIRESGAVTNMGCNTVGGC